VCCVSGSRAADRPVIPRRNRQRRCQSQRGRGRSKSDPMPDPGAPAFSRALGSFSFMGVKGEKSRGPAKVEARSSGLACFGRVTPSHRVRRPGAHLRLPCYSRVTPRRRPSVRGIGQGGRPALHGTSDIQGVQLQCQRHSARRRKGRRRSVRRASGYSHCPTICVRHCHACWRRCESAAETDPAAPPVPTPPRAVKCPPRRRQRQASGWRRASTGLVVSPVRRVRSAGWRWPRGPESSAGPPVPP